MAKIMSIIEKETKGKSYHTYKYSYDSIGLPSIDYDDKPEEVMKWLDSGETDSPTKAVPLKEYADSIGADYYAKDAMATVRYAVQQVEKVSEDKV